jgi:hypothetical protein
VTSELRQVLSPGGPTERARPDQDAHPDVGDVAPSSADPYHFEANRGRASPYARSPDRNRVTPCGVKTVAPSLPRPRPDTDHAPETGRHDRPHAPRIA